MVRSEYKVQCKNMGIKKKSHQIIETEIPVVGLVKAGKILEHPMFGVGEVVEIAQWESGDITICLNFEDHGSKWLAPEYAKLSEPKDAAKKTGLLSKIFGTKK